MNYPRDEIAGKGLHAPEESYPGVEAYTLVFLFVTFGTGSRGQTSRRVVCIGVKVESGRRKKSGTS